MANSPTSKTGHGGIHGGASADAGVMRGQHSVTQKLRLGTASVDEINAAYTKIYPELVNLAHYYAGMVNIPFVNVNAMIEQKMQTPEFKKMAVQIIADAITAAESVHDNQPQTATSP